MGRKLSSEEYWMSGGGIVCPLCRNYVFSSPDQVMSFQHETNITRIERLHGCAKCGTKWTEYYVMARVHITHLGNPD